MQFFTSITVFSKMPVRRLLIPVSLLLYLTSCGGEPQKLQTSANTDDSEVLSKEFDVDPDYNSMSNRFNSDLVQELFDEEVNKTPELQNLVEQVRDLEQMKKDSLEDYNGFVQNNSKYITAANDYIDQISDTVLKKDMKKAFADFESSYEKMVVPSRTAMNTINNKTIELNNHLVVLKLLVTKSVMQKYRMKHLPDVHQMSKIQTKYDLLIDKTKNYPSGE